MKQTKKVKITDLSKKKGTFEYYKKHYALLSKKGVIISSISATALLGGLSVGTYFIGKNNANIDASLATITLDAVKDGAVFASGDSKVSFKVKKGTKLVDGLKSAGTPIYKNYKFKEWKLNNKEISSNYIVDKDITLKAGYQIEQCAVTLYAGANGNGTFGNADDSSIISRQTFLIDKGSSIEEALDDVSDPILYKTDTSGGKFKGWSIDGLTILTDDDKKSYKLEDNNCVIYALYDKVGGTSSEVVNVTFNAGDFDSEAEDTFKKAPTVATLPQTGIYDYNGKEYTTFTVGYVDDSTGVTLEKIMKDDEGWYGKPEGNYAGFKHWYLHGEDSSTAYDYTKKLEVGTYKFEAKYEPHFATDISSEEDTSDPWRAVVNNANLGLNWLHTIYHEECEKNADFPNTLIGYSRWVELKTGSKYLFNVLDENRDFMSASYDKTKDIDSETHTVQGGIQFSDPIPLTFAPLNKSNLFYLPSECFDGKRFYKSSFRRTVENLQELFPTYLKNNLQKAQKLTLKYISENANDSDELLGSGSGGETSKELMLLPYSTSMCPISISEMNFMNAFNQIVITDKANEYIEQVNTFTKKYVEDEKKIFGESYKKSWNKSDEDFTVRNTAAYAPANQYGHLESIVNESVISLDIFSGSEHYWEQHSFKYKGVLPLFFIGKNPN